MKIRRLLFLWELPQLFLGFFMYALLRKKITYRQSYRDASVFAVKGFPGGISLSWFIFINENEAADVQVVRHEYGHSIQSLILGWLYLIIVGLPSIIRASKWNRLKLDIKDYYRGFPENWANVLGKAVFNFMAILLLIIIMHGIPASISCKNSNIANCKNQPVITYQQTDTGKLNILTQNMMLIPFGFVAPQFKYRTALLAETLKKGDFNIIGLQEIFSDTAQDNILEAWHGKDENLWTGIKEAREVSVLAAEKKRSGIQIIDAKPNTLPAKISVGPYYVLGPDCNSINLFKQDSGLMILSRFHVIAASAFSFSQMEGSDRLANKGVLYARIKTGPGENDYIHFFTTHLQSHDYPEARLSNLKELLSFVSNIIAGDLKQNKSGCSNGNLNGDFGGINPVIITGDINIRAFVPEGWAKKAGIVENTGPDSKDKEAKNKLSLTYAYDEQVEYESFMDEINNFTNALNTDQYFYLKDLWADLYPAEPGFTWMGKDWQTSESNPYGTDGNQYAIEEGPPERIDYILFFAGSRDFSLKPQNLVLYPANGSGIQLSDHLGISCSLQLVDNL